MRHPQTTLSARSFSDDGQVMLSAVFGLSTVLIGVLAIGLDMTNLFFHRTAAQGAADAACQAAAMDMLSTVQGTALGGFTTGTNFDCASTSSAAPCKYAALNGYASPGLTEGVDSNDVSVSFPSSVPGITTPPSAVAGGHPFVQVDVVDRIRTFFSAVLTGSKTQDVRVKAACGLITTPGPAPIIVLHPTMQASFSIGGTPTVQVVGGPPRGVQVNSRNANAASYNGTAMVDLSRGGPSFTGGFFGVVGGPSTPFPPSNFNSGTTGGWAWPSSPLPDPLAQVAPPSKPAAPGNPPGCSSNPCSVAYHVNGCPDSTGCTEYAPGLYTKTLQVKNETAIFDPGIYYIQASSSALSLNSNSLVRPSTATGDGSGGMLFYLSGGTVSIGSNSGYNTADAFDTSRVACPGSAAPNPPLAATLGGNVMLAPCTTSGTYNVPPTPQGSVRGIVLFQDRSNTGSNAAASMNGGGGLLVVGTMYFHDCPNSLTGPCSAPPTDYQASLTLQGNSGATTQILGDIITDQLSLGGNSTISMQLNPYSKYSLLQVALLQ